MFFQKLKKMLMYGSSFKLRPYEEAVLNSWRKELSSEGIALLSVQLMQLVSYQRQAGELLCFFPLGRNPPPPLPEGMLFPCRLDCAVALVHLAGSDKRGARHNVRAEIGFYKGRIILIEFNHPPSKRLVHDVEVTKVEILRDPMIPASEETVSNAQRREEVLKNIHSKLPGEYLQLVGESKGISINEWEVCAVQDIQKIPQRDGNYYALTHKQAMGFVGIKEDEYSGELYYLDYDHHLGEKITVSLREFLEKFDGGKVEGRF